jgi:hypothetical protein
MWVAEKLDWKGLNANWAPREGRNSYSVLGYIVATK